MIQAARSAEFVLEIVYLSACLRTSRSHPETVENSCLLVYLSKRSRSHPGTVETIVY